MLLWCTVNKAAWVRRQRRHRSGGKRQPLLLQLLQLPHHSGPARAPPEFSSLLLALSSLRNTLPPRHLLIRPHLYSQRRHQDQQQTALLPLTHPPPPPPPQLYHRNSRNQLLHRLVMMPRQLPPQLQPLPSRLLPGPLLGANQHKPQLRQSQQLLSSQHLLLLQSPAQHLLHSSSSQLPSRQSRHHKQIKHSRQSRRRQQHPSQAGRYQTSLGRKTQLLRPSQNQGRRGANLAKLLVSDTLQASVNSPVHGASLRRSLHRLSLRPSSNLSPKIRPRTQTQTLSRRSRTQSLSRHQVRHSRPQSRHLLRPQQRWTRKVSSQQAQRLQARQRV